MVNLIEVKCDDEWHEQEPGPIGSESMCPNCGMIERIHKYRAEYIEGNKVLL